jgi:tagatose 6-phosphate kinase
MILCIGTTPAAQRVMVFHALALDAVNRAITTLDGAAGKAVNVAKILKALGEEPVAMGFLGGDRGKRIGDLLKERGIGRDFISVDEPTRQCLTILDQSAGTQTELVEESKAVPGADYQRLLRRVRRRLGECHALVMSGTITPGGPVSFYLECARMAQQAGALSAVDARGAVLVEALKGRPGLIKPNHAELEATVGRELKTPAGVVAAMHELHERGAQRVVVTAGKGPALAMDGIRVWRIVPPRIAAVNPIGSGDAFTAGLVWRLLRGDDLGEACRWGAAAGTANALTMMAGEVEPRMVRRLAKGILVQPLRT